MIKRLSYFLLVAVFATMVGCTKTPSTPPQSQQLNDFLANTNEGAYNSGEAIIIYDLDNHQTASNPGRKTYRIQTDDQQVYLHCALSAIPGSIDQEIVVTVDSKGITGITPGTYKTQLKKSESNKHWLWDESKSLGFVVKF